MNNGDGATGWIPEPCGMVLLLFDAGVVCFCPIDQLAGSENAAT